MKKMLFIIVLLGLSSCKKEDVITPITSSSNQVNKFIGYLTTYDYLYPDSNQSSNIQVRVLGDGNQVIATSLTDSTGMFQIDNLPIGTFDFEYTKSGWAKYTTLSVTNFVGPKPTILSFTNSNPYNNLSYPLVRMIYSDIIDCKLDSLTTSMWSNYNQYHFTVTVNVDSSDDLSKVNMGIYSTNFIGDGYNSFFSVPDSVRFIPPNKIYVRTNAYQYWASNESKSVYVSMSSTKDDPVHDLLLIRPTEYSRTFKSEGAINFRTFSIMKP